MSAKQLKPLAISCTDTDCESDLHCFLQKKKRGGVRRMGGPCRQCGANLVQWNRVNARDPHDVSYTFQVQRQEYIRHEFWPREFDQHAFNHARRKGLDLLREAARKRIAKSVGGKRHAREGQQTPFEGNVLYYAQHAVAACCRKCIEYWHGIEAGRPLSEAEIEYLTRLVLLYVEERLPNLSHTPERVAPVQRKMKK